MLLDLLQAEIAQHRVPVSSLCIAAAVPATTALRWIKTMTDVGLFKRRADPHDAAGCSLSFRLPPATCCGATFTKSAKSPLYNCPRILDPHPVSDKSYIWLLFVRSIEH
jgi:hypothetical protein